MALRRPARGPHDDFDPAWFLWPAVVLVALLGAAFLVSVLNELPAPQPQPAEVGASAPGT